MASFAPGTSQEYMDDYNRHVEPRLHRMYQGSSRPPMARPDSRNSVTVGGGRVSPYSPPGSPPRAGQQSNRPFQGTLPPVVPQQQSPDMSAYAPSRSAGMRWTGTQWQSPPARPGRAQPMPPPSQGTPYGSAPPSPRPAGRYAHGTSPEYMAANPDWLPMGGYGPRPQQPSVIHGGGAGNFANMPPDRRPPPFAMTTTDWSGKQAEPSQLFAQRDAFVQSINDARAPLALRAGMGIGGPPPQRDFGRMWGRAGDMVSQGWQNPLTGLLGGGNAMLGPTPPASTMMPPGARAAGPSQRAVAPVGFGRSDPAPMPMAAYDPFVAQTVARINRRKAMQ